MRWRAARRPMRPRRCATWDFAIWQRQWLQGPEAARHRDYWTRQLAEEAPVLQIGRGTAAPSPQAPEARDAGAAQHLLAVPAPLARALRQRARAHGTTLFCVLLAGFHAVLFRHAGHAVQRVGVPVAGRNRPETADVAGVFINTVVMQARPAPQMPLSALLAQVHATALEAREHEDLPFEHVAQVLRPERTQEGGGLFQCMFNHLGEGGRPLAGWPGLAVRRVDPGLRAAPFGLTLETMEDPGGGLLAAFRYDGAKFTPQEMAEIAGHYERMLDALAHDPGRPVGEVAMLGDAERARLQAWSAGGGGRGPGPARAPDVRAPGGAHARCARPGGRRPRVDVCAARRAHQPPRAPAAPAAWARRCWWAWRSPAVRTWWRRCSRC